MLIRKQIKYVTYFFSNISYIFTKVYQSQIFLGVENKYCSLFTIWAIHRMSQQELQRRKLPISLILRTYGVYDGWKNKECFIFRTNYFLLVTGRWEGKNEKKLCQKTLSHFPSRQGGLALIFFFSSDFSRIKMTVYLIFHSSDLRNYLNISMWGNCLAQQIKLVSKSFSKK